MSSDNSNNPTYFVAEGLVPMMPSQAPNLRYPSSRPFPILDQENHENPSQEDEDEEEEEENDEEDDEDEDIKQDPATTWRNFLKPGQRHTIDWYDFAHTERFHSREYDPHQGVGLAERWRESRASPSLQGNSPGQGPISTDQALNPSSQGLDLSGQELSGQGSSDGIDDNSEPNYMTTLRSAEQNREVPTGVTTLTSLLNPIPQNALESFHRKQLESWNADLLSYKEAFCKLMDRSRSLKSQYDCWVLLEERLCSAVDCYQRLIHQNNELDNVLQTLREIGQSMRYMFALLSNTDATLREGLLGESSEEMEARLSGSNNEAMCQIITAQLEIARCSDEEKQKVQSLRNGLGLLDTIGGISGTFSEYNLSHPDRGPFAGYDLFSILKAKGRANQLSDQFHRPKLDVLEADAQRKRRIVKINEVRLDLSLYLFNLAMDIATPCNGAQVRYLNSIESPIALRMFNTPSVCQLEKLEVDFKRMDWPKQDWRMYPSRNVMSEPLISAMNAHQNASTNINMETVVDRCLEVGNGILARNWRSLEELIWRGPCCYKCYNGIKHNCDFRKPYRLDVDKIFEEIMAQVHVGQGSQQQQQQYFSGLSDIYANQEFLNVYPPFFGQSRLVVLSLNHWLFTRDCLTRILEFSPHLLSLSLTQCTMKGNAKSEESIFGGYPKGRGCGQGNTPVFQHRGLRVLAISISTLFTQERHSAFYGILDGQHPDDAIETDRLLSDDNDSENDSLSSYLVSDDEEEEEEESMENEALGHFSPPSPPKRRSGNSPRKVTPWQVEAIDSLESSLFEHFPNLEHWKLVPGMQNSLQVTWIGREVQRYCPNLNKLTIASDAFVDSECTAILVRSFRPMPPHQLSTGVNSAIYNIPLEEENDSDNISLLRGYRLANGKGLKVFRAEEELYGRALVKALLLHSSTLEVLDLDASNEYWNIWPGEIDGDHVRAPRRYDLDERARVDTIQSYTRPLQDNNVMPPLPSPPLHASQVALVNGQGIGLGYGNQITPGTLTTGTAHLYPNSAPHTPLPMTQSPSIQSSTAHHPTTLPPLSPPPDSEPSVFSDDDDEDAYQGPWVLRRPYSFLDTLLQQSTRLRQIKLPRNEVDIMQTLLTPNWQCASTLEELWISVHGLYNADDIAQIMRDMRAVEVTVFERLRDRYDNPEGVVPLSTKDTNNNDEDDEDEDDLDSNMPKEPKGKDTRTTFTSHKKFQEYMDENLRYEDDDVDSEDITRQRDAVPASTNATLPIPGTLRYQVIQLLRQFTSLRYLWIGEGLYMLPPRVSNEPQNDTTIEPDSTGMLSKIPFSILQNGDEMALIAETDQFDTDFKMPLLGYPNMNYQDGGGAGLTYVSGSLPSEIGFIAAGHFDTATQQQKYFERMALKRGQSEIVQEVSDISPLYKKQHTI
ncbi:hypothetical protein BGZ49_007180 [Haplosporangium sp. Z 27]|nr:hypothetical protein BGZ49_007180 [Haplosporangium sp. Z 27]